ncbi:MAG: helix-turn-helix domain-containing protein [Bdellovibrionota bacterium]
MAKSASVKKEIRDELLKKVREGMSVKDAAERYGVSTASIYNWLGRKADGGKSEILELSRLKREKRSTVSARWSSDVSAEPAQSGEKS